MIRGTVCHVIKDGKTLLLKKAPGLFGEGKWNSPGGKIRDGETPQECIAREILEETGLVIFNPTHHGAITFYFGDEEEPAWVVDVFSTSAFSGEAKEECGEGILRWISTDELPYEEMWEDDRYWLPLVFNGKRFEAKFYFDRDLKKIIKHEIKILESIL